MIVSFGSVVVVSAKSKEQGERATHPLHDGRRAQGNHNRVAARERAFETVGRGIRDVGLADLKKIGILLLEVVEDGGISCQGVDIPPLCEGLFNHESSDPARSSDHSDFHDAEMKAEHRSTFWRPKRKEKNGDVKM